MRKVCVVLAVVAAAVVMVEGGGGGAYGWGEEGQKGGDERTKPHATERNER
jgi:hypothetical protein